MKSSLVALAALLSVCMLSGCSSMEKKSTYVEPKAVHYPNGVKVETDAAYVNAVERIARRRGIDLQWINMPTRHIAVADH